MRKQAGQALVLVLLSLAVVLTLVLFVLARSTTDIAVSSRSEAAARAFSAAEAGIENSLVIGEGSSGSFADAEYSSSVTAFAEAKTEFNYPIDLSSGDTMLVWFASHDTDGNIGTNTFSGTAMTVCWGAAGTAADSKAPAIEVSVFYEATPGVPGSTQIARGAYDPYAASRNPANNFTPSGGSGCTVDGVNYAFQQSVNFSSLGISSPTGLLYARVRMLYNNAPQSLGVKVTGGTLPSQGQDISSTGSAGDANRKVQVFQGWSEAPPVFDYAIYSGSGITR